MEPAIIPDLFLDVESSDIKIHVDTTACEFEVVLPGHSHVLKQASEVFKKMLNEMKFKESHTGVVKLKVQGNIEDAIHFLRYLYVQNLGYLGMHSYVCLIQAAHLYELTSLVNLCSDIIVSGLTPWNVCETYRNIEKVATEETLAKCRELMLNFAFLIFVEDLHLSLSEETMEHLLRSDNLNVLDEEQCERALWRWGFANSVQNLSSTGRDTGTTISKLTSLIRLKDVQSGISQDGENCNTGPRTPQLQPSEVSKFAHIHFFVNQKSYSNVSCKTDKENQLLIFQVDRNILLMGLILQINVSGSFDPNSSFRLSFNHKDVTKLIKIETSFLVEHVVEISNSHSCMIPGFSLSSSDPSLRSAPKKKRVLNYKMRIIFVTPVEVRRHVINKLCLSVPQQELDLQMSKYSQTTCIAETLSPDGLTRFVVIGEILGLKGLYYFNRC